MRQNCSSLRRIPTRRRWRSSGWFSRKRARNPSHTERRSTLFWAQRGSTVLATRLPRQPKPRSRIQMSLPAVPGSTGSRLNIVTKKADTQLVFFVWKVRIFLRSSPSSSFSSCCIPSSTPPRRSRPTRVPPSRRYPPATTGRLCPSRPGSSDRGSRHRVCARSRIRRGPRQNTLRRKARTVTSILFDHALLPSRSRDQSICHRYR
ncbi:hypothetical protein DHEL01_v211444 [Diaporthe helianthi]|uniref:Uncharacterized protein n=1 Tax=Diaporthe helianthi TaxID=158607 RepID=A0A2P5HIU2_DIAHE|nr:hypothetical protein DHEL01_v211444 [Diaporthe helianthi]